MLLVPAEWVVEVFSAAAADPASLIAFICGMLFSLRTTWMSVTAWIVSKRAGYLPSRSRMKNRRELPAFSRSMTG
ncbi:hypothetical protein ADK67_14455, partial [Saccharothrix sp. NRRL B-16348]